MIFQQLLDVVKDNKRHANYDRNCKLATLYEQLITGEGIEELMQQYNPREDYEQFEQRKRITQQITPSVCNSLMTPAYKVPRSSSMTKAITWSKKVKDDTKKSLQDNLNKFNGRQSFDDFCSTTFIDLNYIDPNGFIIFEFKPFDNVKEYAKPYPFIVSSKDAIYYEYIGGILQYIVVYDQAGKYTYYDKKGSQVLILVDEVEIGDKSEPVKYTVKISTSEFLQPANETFIFEDKEYIIINSKLYAIITPLPYDLKEVPAYKVGFRSQKNRPDVYEAPITPAIPHLKKSIKAVSEMDLTMALHCFPQKFIYDKPCPDCSGGFMPDGNTCKSCQGEGTTVHKSSQDTIRLRMPKSPEEIIDLQRLIHQEYPPIDGIRFQNEYIDSLTAKCKEAIWNTDLFTRDEITQTATSKNIEMQSVYDVLYPFALHYSDFWEWGIRIIADIMNIEDVTPVMHFSKDFKFMSKQDYIAMLEAAKTAGASPMIIKNIEAEIIKIDYEENPELWNKYLVQEWFRPFADKTPQTVLALISRLPQTDNDVILWTYFEDIFKQVELDNPDFYMLDRKEQQTLINAQIESYKQ